MIAIENLNLRFHSGTPDERVALDAVSFAIVEGQFVVVIGTNGAGKTSLLNTIAGSIVPDTGRIAVDGVDIVPMPIHQRARFVARVFQDPMVGTVPALTIEENLAFAAKRGTARKFKLALSAKAREHFRATLAPFRLGLENRLTAVAGSLSGGQRQVLALVMATIHKPKVLLLDEHTAALDPRTAQVVIDATTRLVEEHRLTTLMVTHNMRHALDCGSRLLMMNAGRIKLDAANGEKRKLTAPELIRRFGEEGEQILLPGEP
jgi:putative tryptophan/tyrosine transport system ATP-binding protein